MAELTGSPQIFAANSTDTSTTARQVLGFKAHDVAGNEYRYVQFGAAAINGEVVAMDSGWVTSRLTSTSRGFVGIALATQAANAYGWVQVYGVNTFVWGDTGLTTVDVVCANATTDLGHLGVPTSANTEVIIHGIHVATAPDSCASTALGTSAVSAPCTVTLAYPFITGQFHLSS